MTADIVDEIRKMTLSKIAEYRQEKLDEMIGGEVEFVLGSHRDFLSEWREWWKWVDIGERVFPVAVQEMGRVADAMGWPCLVPKWFSTQGFWEIQWLMGYQFAARKSTVDGRPLIVRNMVTAVVGIDVWCDGGPPSDEGFYADVGFAFGDANYQFVKLVSPVVDDEASFRVACREAIFEAYRAYMDSGEYVPALERWALEKVDQVEVQQKSE